MSQRWSVIFCATGAWGLNSNAEFQKIPLLYWEIVNLRVNFRNLFFVASRQTHCVDSNSENISDNLLNDSWFLRSIYKSLRFYCVNDLFKSWSKVNHFEIGICLRLAKKVCVTAPHSTYFDKIYSGESALTAKDVREIGRWGQEGPG